MAVVGAVAAVLRRRPAPAPTPIVELPPEIEARLARADRLAALGKAVGGVVHELNNPLTCLLANLEFVALEVERSELGSERRAELDELLADCFESVKLVRALLTQLRRFGRTPRGGEGLAAVSEVVEAACTILRATISRRAQLVVDLEGGLVVAGDREPLVHVLIDLLDNAVQSLSDAGSHEHEIAISGRSQGDTVVLEVRDTGCGIADDAMAKVFEPFYTTRPEGEGSGLGLSTCRALVRSLGGELSIESEPGRGTTVRVTLASAAAYLREAA